MKALFWAALILLNAAVLAASTEATSVWTFVAFFGLAIGVFGLMFNADEQP